MNSNLITKQSVNAIFQVENDTELKGAILGLFNMYNPNSHISNPDHTLSNIDDAYIIDINPIEIDIERIKKNWSDLNEKLYKYIVLRSIDFGILPESVNYIFKYNPTELEYEPIELKTILFDLKFELETVDPLWNQRAKFPKIAIIK